MRAWLFAFLILSATAASAAPRPLTLASPQLQLTFDRETGVLESLQDVNTKREWLAPGGGKRLYEITLLRQGEEPLRLTWEQASGIRVKRTYEAVQLNAEAHGDVPVGVRVEFSVDPLTGLVNGRISVKNQTPHPVDSVRFPLFATPVRLGAAAEDDRLLLPLCDGAEIHNPEANLRGARYSQYPGAASMQLLAAYDGGGGLFLATLDSEGHRKHIGFARQAETVEPYLRHYPGLEARAQWALPYPVVLAGFTGDWQTAASLYRAWALQQPWCRTPLRKRKDIPEWLFQPSFYLAASLRGGMPDGTMGSRLPLAAEQVAAYHKAVGAPVVAMLMSWEKHGPWITPDYFPPFGGEEAFRQVTGALRKNGDRSLVYLSGLKWTLNKKWADGSYESEAQFKEQAERWAIVGPDGKVQRSGAPDRDVGEYAQICPGTAYARTLLSEVVRQCQALGIDCVQVDQIVGGGMPPCYSKEHGHPQGGGTWSARAVYALFERLRAEGRSRNKEFAFLMEEPGEYFIPVLDAYHARDYLEGRWPRDGAGVHGVPLFTYVYHDYCLGYGGDSATLDSRAGDMPLYQHAMNLISGKLPAGAFWTRWQPAENLHPGQTRLLRDCEALLASPVGEVLLKGQRMPSAPVRCEPLMLRLAPRPGVTEERPYPSILHAIYAMPNGRVSRVFVNLGKERERIEVAIPAMGLPGQRLRLTLHRVEDGKVTQESELTPTPSIYPLTLPPLAPVVLDSQPAGWQVPQ